MPMITLPDGSQKAFDKPVTVAELAQSIGTGLAKAALAGKVNSKLVDTDYLIKENVSVNIITAKNEEGLEIIRHSTAHLLAQAVKQLFPKAQVTIGPVIENGFYYDFAYESGFKAEDLPKIEEKMKELAKQNYPVTHEVIKRYQAIQYFKAQGEHYKVEIIENLPQDEVITIYKQGDFTDLCRGPHVPNTGHLKAFKLTKLAGAYWRGDSNNEMLQRIYGTAWADKDALKDYLNRLAEAEKRDHRKVAKKMDLFHLQPEAPGMVFWHPRGWAIYLEMQNYIREKLRKWNYEEIRTPQLVDKILWEKSGHWEKFGTGEMFLTESENHIFAVKPMSCPCHVQVFNQGLRSYKDLPLRLAEFGSCHRNEPSGTLHGLMRVRHMVQDDGHIFCREDQIAEEVSNFIDQLFEVYKDFGFEEVRIKLATRPEKRVGSDEIWDRAEKALEQALNQKGLEWSLNPGEGAFYGPKLELTLKDCMERLWQLGTMQVDFSMPGRLNATYITEDSSKQVPVMLHRAIFGSFERFLGVLLEHYAGLLPLWLAPIQIAVLTITDHQAEYARSIAKTLQNRGFRVDLDLRNEKIGFKIRTHTIARVPYLAVIGDKEVEAKTIALRVQTGKDLGTFSLFELIDKLEVERMLRSRTEE